MGTEINITRCNLLLTRKVIKALANQIELANYYEGCPPLYTTSLITNAPATFITSINSVYSVQAPYSTTEIIPAKTTVIPAVINNYKPNLFVSSNVSNGSSISYYSGLNCTGNLLFSETVTAGTNGDIVNFYSGVSSSGNTLGSAFVEIDPTNSSNLLYSFYSGANNSGNIVGSAVTPKSGGIGTVYSEANGGGSILGSSDQTTSGMESYYSGANASGSLLGSNFSVGEVYNLYNNNNYTTNPGLTVNQFFLPYPTNETIGSVTTTTQPSILVKSYVVNSNASVASLYNTNPTIYYSGANGTGDVVGYYQVWVNNNDIESGIVNYYSGSPDNSTLVGSISSYVNNNSHTESNIYSGANGTGNILGSFVNRPMYGTDNYTYYSGANEAGSVLGTRSDEIYYGSEAGSSLGGYTYFGYVNNYYSGLNGTGNPGIYLNMFALPFTFSYTTPSYTVTTPSTTVTIQHPGIYSLLLATPLPGVPTGIYLDSSLSGDNLIGSNSDINILYLNGPQSFTVGQTIYVIVNNVTFQVLINNGAVYTNQTAYTIPSTSTTVPATVQVSQPSILVGSFTPNDSIPCYNYYSEANGQGTALGSEVISSTGSGRTFYSGINGTGNLLNSKIYNTAATENLPIFNYYTGSNNSGNILLSGTGDPGAPSTYYSSVNSSGTELGTRQNSANGYSFYSLSNDGTTNTLIGEMNVTTYNGSELANTYTVANGVNSPGLYLNPVFLPYPFTETTPAHTVTTPAVNYPAINSLTASIPLEAVPTAVYAVNNGIADTTNNLLGSDSTLTNVNLNTIESFSIGDVVQFIVNGGPVNLTITNINLD